MCLFRDKLWPHAASLSVFSGFSSEGSVWESVWLASRKKREKEQMPFCCIVCEVERILWAFFEWHTFCWTWPSREILCRLEMRSWTWRICVWRGSDHKNVLWLGLRTCNWHIQHARTFRALLSWEMPSCWHKVIRRSFQGSHWCYFPRHLCKLQPVRTVQKKCQKRIGICKTGKVQRLGRNIKFRKAKTHESKRFHHIHFIVVLCKPDIKFQKKKPMERSLLWTNHCTLSLSWLLLDILDVRLILEGCWWEVAEFELSWRQLNFHCRLPLEW